MDYIIKVVKPAFFETLYLVSVPTLLAILIGIPAGVILFISREDGLSPNKTIYGVLDWIVNVIRSFPFIVLMFICFPLSKMLLGKSVGTTAALVPLTIAAAPFVARIIEGYMLEIDKGVIEAAKAMGSSTFQIITKVLIPEAMPSIISGITMTVISIIGYSAMAGVAGGGGLGDIANTYGYQRGKSDILWTTVVILILLVQIVQFIGTKWAKAINKK